MRAFNPEDLKIKAGNAQKSTKELFKKFKKGRKNIDTLFHELHDELLERMKGKVV